MTAAADGSTSRMWLPYVAVRRSILVWALPALVAVEIINSLARQQEWAIEWQWAAYWSNVATYIVGPLAAGLAAVESIVYRRREVDRLLGRGWTCVRAHGLRVAAALVVGLLAHLVGVAACLLASVRVHRAFHPSVQPTVPAFAALTAWVLLGAAIGWLWPSLALPPLLAVSGVGLATITSLGPLQPFVRVGTATTGLTGLVTRPAYTVVLTVWWIVLAGVAFRVLVRRGRSVQWPDLVAAGLMVVSVVAVLWQGRDALARTAQRPSQACSAGEPILCVTSDYSPRLSAYTPVLLKVSHALSRLDPAAVPSRFEQAGERIAGSPPVSGVGVITISARGRPGAFDLAWDLVEGASGCPQASTAPSVALANDEVRLASWLVRDAGFDGPSAVPPEEEIRSAVQATQVLAALKTDC